MRAVLNITAPGLERGMSVTLSNGQEISIGSSRWADLKLEDRSLSSVHMQLSLISGECWLRDLKSATGTLVNGTRILATEICDGDVICSGETSITISLVGDRLPSDLPQRISSELNEGSSIDSGEQHSPGLSTVA